MKNKITHLFNCSSWRSNYISTIIWRISQTDKWRQWVIINHRLILIKIFIYHINQYIRSISKIFDGFFVYHFNIRMIFIVTSSGSVTMTQDGILDRNFSGESHRTMYDINPFDPDIFLRSVVTINWPRVMNRLNLKWLMCWSIWYTSSKKTKEREIFLFCSSCHLRDEMRDRKG